MTALIMDSAWIRRIYVFLAQVWSKSRTTLKVNDGTIAAKISDYNLSINPRLSLFDSELFGVPLTAREVAHINEMAAGPTTAGSTILNKVQYP